MTDSQKDLLIHLLQQGDWTDAVVAYCEETGADVETATHVVRQLAEQNAIRPARRWWLLGLTLVATLLVTFIICR
ncbi:MAG: hypothetical protein R3C05_25575 [Pirellulaceae bacterium]